MLYIATTKFPHLLLKMTLVSSHYSPPVTSPKASVPFQDPSDAKNKKKYREPEKEK